MKKLLILMSLLAMLVVMSGCKDKKAPIMENVMITTESAVTTEASVTEPAVTNATVSAITTESGITESAIQ